MYTNPVKKAQKEISHHATNLYAVYVHKMARESYQLYHHFEINYNS